jgi:hypothetical protein
MKASIGRIVIYTLKQEDVDQINRKRTNAYSIAERIKEDKWPIGAQAHIGNQVNLGDKFPMVIIRVWSDTLVNGQVLLDGNDTFWTTSVSLGVGNGTWDWPERV